MEGVTGTRIVQGLAEVPARITAGACIPEFQNTKFSLIKH